MDALELRINNVVFLTKDNFKTVKPYTMSGIDIYKVDESDCFDISPIPLNDGKLAMLGFCYNGDYFDRFIHNENNHIIIFKNDEGDYYIDLRFPNGQMISIFLKFVHQLQNLYFSLIGQELHFTNTF